MTGGARFLPTWRCQLVGQPLDAVRRRRSFCFLLSPVFFPRFPLILPCSRSCGAPSPPPVVAMSPAKSSDAGSGAQPSTGEMCGSSNPTKATAEEEEEEDPQYSVEFRAARSFAAVVKANPVGIQHIASAFSGV